MAFQFEGLSEILVCPKSRTKLVQQGDALVNVDPQTRLQYAIRDDIPVLLVDEATELSVEDWQAVMQQHGRDPQTGEKTAASDGA